MTRSMIALSLAFTAMAGSARAQRATTQPADVRTSGAASATDSTTIKNRAAFLLFVEADRRTFIEAAHAMPADKYGFAPRDGEFANVRTFSQQIRHFAATNYILAAAALGEHPPADAGDEQGPDSVITKAQHIAYLR